MKITRSQKKTLKNVRKFGLYKTCKAQRNYEMLKISLSKNLL